jgi:hypothetical protein
LEAKRQPKPTQDGSIEAMIAAITKEEVLQINFDKESENGNIEYKWRLINISPERQVHLTTQMKYRLDVWLLI